jgi:hypothetical protein
MADKEIVLNKYVYNFMGKGKIKTNEAKYFQPRDDRLPKELLAMYEQLGSCLNGFVLGRWYFMSSTEAQSRNEELYRHGETTIYNFAMVYHDLGWVIMAAIDLENGMVFLRMDGGSDGYDAKMNLVQILAYRKNADKFTDKLIEFRKFINLCISEEKNRFNELIPESYFIH